MSHTTDQGCSVEIGEEQLDIPFPQRALPLGESANHQGVVNSSGEAEPHVLEKFLASLAAPRPRRGSERLLDEFGSISDMLGGSRWRLNKAIGVRLAGVIEASSEMMRAALTERIEQRPLIFSSQAVLDYLHLELGFFERERLLALYLDHKSRLIRIVRLADGGPAEVPLNRGRIISEGLNLGAAGFVLVHNHPSGDPLPSTEDVRATASLASIATQLDMPLIDHIIVARGRVWSFNGLTDN